MKTNVGRYLAVSGVVLALLAIGVVGVGSDARRATSRNGGAISKPDSMPIILAWQASATVTPTPRVIVIQPTATPGSPPTATAELNRAALPTATPPVITVETSEPDRSTPVPTATPLPTATPAPSPTPLPTTPPSPTPISAAPTMAPVGDIRLTFSAADWAGGYYRGDSQAYGRPWVAVYGALSDFPRATLRFTLDATPDREATINITGLDDEWGELNPVTLEVNGEPIYSGASPFPNWDGVGTGANAAWTTVPFSIPAGVLRSGPNEITFANQSPVASFNAPPYVLLSDASLEISGRRGGEAGVAPTLAPIVPSDPGATFTAADWRGALYQQDSQLYGRPWAAIYGAASAYPSATLRFRLDTMPSAPAILRVMGLDDELASANPIVIEVNGQPAFNGLSPFQNWDGVSSGENVVWTEVEVTIPADLLREGRNEITIANLSPSGNTNSPPYVLLSEATLDAPGTRVTAVTPDGSRSQGDRGGGDEGDDDNDDDGDDGNDVSDEDDDD